MKAPDLILRCLAEKIDDGSWQAFCLDLDLAVQGDSFVDVEQKLESLIDSWLEDALVGEDREHAYELLNRKAPVKWWLKYYYALVLYKLGRLHNSARILFRHPMPLRISHGH